jgi:predicted nucleic acid-binding protein
MTELPTVDLTQPYLGAAAVLDRHGRRSVVLIADASAVLQDMRHAVQNREVGIVGRLVLLGAIHMPAEMVAEVEEHIADLEGPRATGEELRAMWAAHYLSGINVHDDVAEAASPEAVEQLARRDPKDLPLLHLAASVSVGVVLTHDKALRHEGFAPDGWLNAARQAERVILVDVQIAAANVAVWLAAEAVVGLVRGSLSGSRAAQLSVVVAAAACLTALAKPRRRQALREVVGACARAVSATLREQSVAVRDLTSYAAAARPPDTGPFYLSGVARQT